eukprot:scaffold27385_cov37-Tisochrysis_lutea.AAC.2
MKSRRIFVCWTLYFPILSSEHWFCCRRRDEGEYCVSPGERPESGAKVARKTVRRPGAVVAPSLTHSLTHLARSSSG